MKYSISRNNIKSGDLIAFRGTGPFSRFIARVTGNSYTHVGIAITMKNRVMVIQDKELKGVELIPLSSMLPCDWIGTNAQWTEEAETFAFSNIGQSYSYINALLAGLGFPPIGKNSICSEYAASVLKKANVLKTDTVILTPGNLVDTLLDLGHPLEKIIG